MTPRRARRAWIGALILSIVGCDARPVEPQATGGSHGCEAGPSSAADASPAVAFDDGGVNHELPPACGWECTPDEPQICRLRCGPHDGLPPGGERWECHLVTRWVGPNWSELTELEWLCFGEVPAGAPAPGGDGWRCERFDFPRPGRDVYRCVKPDEERDWPPGVTSSPRCKMERGASCAFCEKGSLVGGTVCQLGGEAPGPAVSIYPNPDTRCEPGAAYWCDDLYYSGWGQVTCKDDGTFPTRVANGRHMLDCQARADGRRPDTICACYHFYFNPRCCERSDCMVPPGTAGQLCPASDGAPCSHCNPLKPECTGGGVCAVANSMEAFCAAPCAPVGEMGDPGCPAGTLCMPVKHRGEVDLLCVPDDFGCYW